MARVPTTLVIGKNAASREAAIVENLDPALSIAVIVEGLPDGSTALNDAALTHPALSVIRIASGCACCIGNLVMRVTLNRVIRQSPDRLFISIANQAHLERIRSFLLQEPYGQCLSLTKELAVSSRS
ncbi:MAG: GTPase [Burkholderiales bacterium]|nr:GTPase [Burkholderiales bacterium]